LNLALRCLAMWRQSVLSPGVIFTFVPSTFSPGEHISLTYGFIFSFNPQRPNFGIITAQTTANPAGTEGIGNLFVDWSDPLPTAHSIGFELFTDSQGNFIGNTAGFTTEFPAAIRGPQTPLRLSVMGDSLSSSLDLQVSAVPGPVLGAGLPGLILACGVLLALARRRRQLVA
jgi:hypothetical protein